MKRRRKIWSKLLLLLIIILFAFVLVKTLDNGFKTPLQFISISPLIFSQTIERKNPLNPVVDKAMEDTEGNYAIVVKNFKTGETYSSNEQKLFNTGSLYKLWVMAEAYQQIWEGTLKEDEVLSQDIAALNQKFGLDPEDAELSQGHIEMTVGSALNQMITISHNYAALLLSDRLKNSNISKFLEREGLSQSSLAGSSDGSLPQASALDIALFYEKLYNGELVSQESSQKMLDLLKKQQLNDGLPKYLPENIEVAHKTGDLNMFKHDAGIVFAKNGDYIIVVLSESDFPPGAQERIALLSQAVYKYFNP